MEYINEKEKVCRIGEFLYQGLLMGYTYSEGYDLFLNSEQGYGIMHNNYTYVIHHTGRTSAIKADKVYGNRYKKTWKGKADGDLCMLLAEFIQLCHNFYKIPYKKIFAKISVDAFMDKFGFVLGNYDHKLVKEYIL